MNIILIKYRIMIYLLLIFFIILIILCFINNGLKREDFTNGDDEYDIQSYVIHMSDNKERKKNIDEQIPKLGDIPIEIFEAVKGKELDLTKFKKNEGDLDNDWIVDNKGKRLNEVGCYASHRGLMKKIIDENKKNGYTLIFEDDFFIEPKNLKDEVYKILDKVPNKDFDILYLGTNSHNHGVKIVDNLYNYDKNTNLYGIHGYLINNKNMEKLYELIKKIDYPIDVKFKDLADAGKIQIYTVYPDLVNQQFNKIKSTINV